MFLHARASSSHHSPERPQWQERRAARCGYGSRTANSNSRSSPLHLYRSAGKIPYALPGASQRTWMPITWPLFWVLSTVGRRRSPNCGGRGKKIRPLSMQWTLIRNWIRFERTNASRLFAKDFFDREHGRYSFSSLWPKSKIRCARARLSKSSALQSRDRPGAVITGELLAHRPDGPLCADGIERQTRFVLKG